MNRFQSSVLGADMRFFAELSDDEDEVLTCPECAEKFGLLE